MFDMLTVDSKNERPPQEKRQKWGWLWKSSHPVYLPLHCSDYHPQRFMCVHRYNLGNKARE